MAKLTKTEISNHLLALAASSSGVLKVSCETIAAALMTQDSDIVIRAVKDGIDNTGLTNMERAIFVFIAGALAVMSAPDLPAD